MLNDYAKIAEQLRKHGTVQGIMKYINVDNIKRQHQKTNKRKGNRNR